MLTREDIYWGLFWKISQKEARWLLRFLSAQVKGVIVGAEQCAMVASVDSETSDLSFGHKFNLTHLGELRLIRFQNDNGEAVEEAIVSLRGDLSWDEKVTTYLHELIHIPFLHYRIEHSEKMINTLVERFLVAHRSYESAEQLLLKQINYEKEATSYNPVCCAQGFRPIDWHLFESFLLGLIRERDRGYAQDEEKTQRRLEQRRKEEREERKLRKISQKA